MTHLIIYKLFYQWLVKEEKIFMFLEWPSQRSDINLIQMLCEQLIQGNQSTSWSWNRSVLRDWLKYLQAGPINIYSYCCTRGSESKFCNVGSIHLIYKWTSVTFLSRLSSPCLLFWRKSQTYCLIYWFHSLHVHTCYLNLKKSWDWFHSFQ